MASTKLTEGAVGALGGGATAEDFKPMMQVTDLKQVQTKQQQATERFRVLLSDGSQLQQGMLATHLNNLVHSQKLQRGSIVTLNDYSCSVIQGRLIVIIMNLDVVVESSELIGQPVATPRTSGPVQSTDRAGTVIGNPQPLGGSSLPGGLVDKANVVGASLEQPVTNQLNSSSFSNTSASGRNIATNVLPSYPKVDVTTNVPPSYPKVEVGGSFSGSSSLSGSYSDQNMSFRNPRPEISRPPLGSYSHPSYPGYQAPSICGGTGHFSTNCPSIMSEPEQPIGAGYVNRVSPGAGVGGASGECFKCHKSGHWARDCPGLSNISPSEPEQPIGAGYVNRVSPGAGVGGASGECFKCHKTGHWARDCPGLSNIPPAYGSSGISPGKYGGFPKQHVGGF
ncbi:replication protein A 70 kDa DNA-binding subunit E [Tripterygium wilfordii]|uniref:Replication protein A 70 kDa DNA-binding subunit E n=1 Tax=Tripterygium wilfordii TaxID=458696 RepID=A0A7J7D2F0_TRIWF|nr:replication protein A 70 kDa DNA-binding subunit E [Tripterygium wilfordii]